MITIHQFEDHTTDFFALLWPKTAANSKPARRHYFFDDATCEIVDEDELRHYYGVSNFSTAAEYFRTLPERKAQREKDNQKDLETEMRTTF